MVLSFCGPAKGNGYLWGDPVFQEAGLCFPFVPRVILWYNKNMRGATFSLATSFSKRRLLGAVLLFVVLAAISLGAATLRNALTTHPVFPIQIYLAGLGSQTPLLDIPSQHQYVGGAFGISAEGGASTLTRVIITEIGSMNPQDLANVHIHYDVSSSYCSDKSFSESDPTFGYPTTFDGSGKALFTGSIPLAASQAACLYAVLDVKSTALNGQTLDLAIVNAETEIVASGNSEVCPDVHNPPPDGQLMDTCPQRTIPGLTTLRLPPPSVTTVAGIGTQAPFLNIPSSAQYVGGTFRMLPDTGGTTVNRIIITEKGTVRADTNLFGVRLHYDLDTTAPYDCSSETFSASDSTYGVTTSFNSLSKATFDGSLAIGAQQAACFYLVLDVQGGAGHNDTLEVEISNPASEVVAAAGSVSPSVAVPINGTTVLTQATPVSVTVSAVGTQASSLNIPSTANYSGGAFRMITDSGSATVTKVSVSEAGSIDEANLTSLKLYYDLDTSAPYDCLSETYNSQDALYSDTATAGRAGNIVSFTGSVNVSTTQAACFYFIFDIESAAQDGSTIEVEIANPSIDVSVSSGARVPSAVAVPINGTTIARRLEGIALFVSSRGIQTSLIRIPSSAQYIGGAFVVSAGSGNAEVTKLVFAEVGTVAGGNIPRSSLYYDLDRTAPYDCASESFSVSDSIYAQGSGTGTESASYTGTVTVTPTQSVCFYMLVDVSEGARDGDTLDIFLSNPAQDVTASSGASVSPSTTVDVQGTTVLSPSALPVIPEGGLIRATGDIDVWIVKYVGSKRFKRLILSPHVFASYGHLRWDDVREVSRSTVDSYITSDLVRADGDTRVFRLFPSGDTGERRWVKTADAFNRLGFDWDAIYTINSVDRDAYIDGLSIE
ncbi:MAG: hypothetical protein A2806_00935 [Candidatus Terrybacteria bacterium RIFCSPHIGHO2_01_FULL_48_17]|uniref:Cohesin domain-containing protein n=1 Tax=Candidatus Terrybacteria bacterium RIFCSPHIGHO2_01_FULL_48_17 TaxID=1802362 RepID=A0A1G2PK51_9BACT|nr:MAG: hypothetical protein A2806_00935 [Candidatus Terrybacteria bacterium RIFCSPHIGHO2_01_FULL_48_17]OHA51884.1 MAG: hypothetical protein A3A30_00950 [Candidatus Terrybacteria bacterium RIFCSPLOWO2_01_FULL_48_14]